MSAVQTCKKQGNTPPQYSGKIEIKHLTWYLQCFVCIIIQGPELQKDIQSSVGV